MTWVCGLYGFQRHAYRPLFFFHFGIYSFLFPPLFYCPDTHMDFPYQFPGQFDQCQYNSTRDHSLSTSGGFGGYVTIHNTLMHIYAESHDTQGTDTFEHCSSGARTSTPAKQILSTATIHLKQATRRDCSTVREGL